MKKMMMTAGLCLCMMPGFAQQVLKGTIVDEQRGGHDDRQPRGVQFSEGRQRGVYFGDEFRRICQPIPEY